MPEPALGDGRCVSAAAAGGLYSPSGFPAVLAWPHLSNGIEIRRKMAMAHRAVEYGAREIIRSDPRIYSAAAGATCPCHEARPYRPLTSHLRKLGMSGPALLKSSSRWRLRASASARKAICSSSPHREISLSGPHDEAGDKLTFDASRRACMRPAQSSFSCGCKCELRLLLSGFKNINIMTATLESPDFACKSEESPASRRKKEISERRSGPIAETRGGLPWRAGKKAHGRICRAHGNGSGLAAVAFVIMST